MQPVIVKVREVPQLDRGGSVVTTPLTTEQVADGNSSALVTRTFADTGETVEHLSAADQMG